MYTRVRTHAHAHAHTHACARVLAHMHIRTQARKHATCTHVLILARTYLQSSGSELEPSVGCLYGDEPHDGGVLTGVFFKTVDKAAGTVAKTGNISMKYPFHDSVYWNVGEVLPVSLDVSIHRGRGYGGDKYLDTTYHGTESNKVVPAPGHVESYSTVESYSSSSTTGAALPTIEDATIEDM